MSNDDTATVSSPENFSGRARSAHVHQVSLDRPGCRRRRRGRRRGSSRRSSCCHSGPEVVLGLLREATITGEVRRRRIDVRRRHRHHADLRPDEPGVEHAAVDRQGGDELRIAEARDVVHGQGGLRAEPRRPGLAGPGSLVAEDQQAVAGQEHVPGRRPREGLLSGELAPHRADQVHATLGDGDDPSAVRLDDVRLVDAGLLDVRVRVLRCAGGRLGAAAEAVSLPWSVTEVRSSGAPAVVAAIPPPTRAIRSSGAWSLKYCSTVSQLGNGFNAPVTAKAAPSPPDAAPAPPEVTPPPDAALSPPVAMPARSTGTPIATAPMRIDAATARRRATSGRGALRTPDALVVVRGQLGDLTPDGVGSVSGSGLEVAHRGSSSCRWRATDARARLKWVFDGALAAVEDRGDVPHAVVLEVVERDRLCLPWGKTTNRLPERCVAFLQLDGARCPLGQAHQSLRLHEASPQHRGGAMAGDPSDPGARRIARRHRTPLPEGGREGVLGDVLGRGPVAGEHERQAQHVPVLLAVEVLERQRLTGLLGRTRNGGERGPRRYGRRGVAHCRCSLAVHHRVTRSRRLRG